MKTVYKRLAGSAIALLLWAFVGTLGMAVSVVPAAAVMPAANNVDRWTPKTDYNIFAYPKSVKPSGQDDFVDRVVKAADAAPKGATMRFTTHGSSDPEIIDALKRASRRGAHVRYLTWHMDYERDGAKHINELTALLGKYDPKKKPKDFVKICKGSCLVKGIKYTHHAKEFTIDFVVNDDGKLSRYLVFTGSSNASTGSSSKSWQHNQLVVGQKKYYEAFTSYFDDMVRERPRTYSKPVKDGNLTVWFYPMKNPVNPQLELLRDISSCKAKKGSGVDGRTVVYFMTFSWSITMKKMAEKLVDLREDGCVVRVAVTADEVDDGILQILRKGKVVTYNTRDEGQFNHAKLLAVSGTVNGRAANTIVSGTLNASVGAMKKNDEYMVRTTNVRSTVLETINFFNTMAKAGKRI